jgi:hypothetical protein
VEEYFRLLRSQIKDGKLKEPAHLDSLDVLKERIANLEEEQVTLQSTNTRDKRTIKDFEDGNPHFNTSEFRIATNERCTRVASVRNISQT